MFEHKIQSFDLARTRRQLHLYRRLTGASRIGILVSPRYPQEETRRSKMNDLLKQLAEDWGFKTVDDMYEAAVFDSVVPSICTNPGCGYSCEMEPDQRAGWCEVCEETSVQSCLVIGGLI